MSVFDSASALKPGAAKPIVIGDPKYLEASNPGMLLEQKYLQSEPRQFELKYPEKSPSIVDQNNVQEIQNNQNTPSESEAPIWSWGSSLQDTFAQTPLSNTYVKPTAWHTKFVQNITGFFESIRNQFEKYTQSAFSAIPKNTFSFDFLFSSKKLLTGITIVCLFVTLLIGFGIYSRGNSSFSSQAKQVAGARGTKSEEKSVTDEDRAYISWVEEKLQKNAEKEEDEDEDQLTNYEEFLIGTDPKNPKTCGNEKTDAENIVDFVNPLTCDEINLNDAKEVEKFKKLIDFDTVNKKVARAEAAIPPLTSKTPDQKDAGESLLGTFGATSLESLNKQQFTADKLKTDIDSIQEKQKYIVLIEKINKYMRTYRSLEPLDRNYEIPVNGAVYLEVSLKYKTPLKYVIAIAQRESRFGTDRYTNSGNLTRPGKYQNIFSMGLDDSGNNIGFETWEAGVESFGKWYKRFNDRGVSDCRKWQIYNPNGDYCKLVEETASQIEAYLQK
jgi:hypothetical protein